MGNRMILWVVLVGTLFLMEQAEAKIIIDRNTGKIIITEPVKVGAVSINHPAVKIIVSPEVIRRNPRSASGNGQDGLRPRRSFDGPPGIPGQATRGKEVILLPANSDLTELLARLDRARVRPKDMATILQSIGKAGALSAEIEFR